MRAIELWWRRTAGIAGRLAGLLLLLASALLPVRPAHALDSFCKDVIENVTRPGDTMFVAGDRIRFALEVCNDVGCCQVGRLQDVMPAGLAHPAADLQIVGNDGSCAAGPPAACTAPVFCPPFTTNCYNDASDLPNGRLELRNLILLPFACTTVTIEANISPAFAGLLCNQATYLVNNAPPPGDCSTRCGGLGFDGAPGDEGCVAGVSTCVDVTGGGGGGSRLLRNGEWPGVGMAAIFTGPTLGGGCPAAFDPSVTLDPNGADCLPAAGAGDDDDFYLDAFPGGSDPEAVLDDGRLLFYQMDRSPAVGNALRITADHLGGTVVIEF